MQALSKRCPKASWATTSSRRSLQGTWNEKAAAVVTTVSSEMVGVVMVVVSAAIVQLKNQ
jgi:hypothetical protein